MMEEALNYLSERIILGQLLLKKLPEGKGERKKFYSDWLKRLDAKKQIADEKIESLEAKKRKELDKAADGLKIWVIMLDRDDHDVDLQNRYQDENADYEFSNRVVNKKVGDDEDMSDTDAWAMIADLKADVFETLFPEEEEVNPKINQLENIYGAADRGSDQSDLRTFWCQKDIEADL